MELAQLESRIAFLESQSRRERADTAQLRHRLDLRESEREELLKRITSLETELAGLKSEGQRLAIIDNKIEQVRTDTLTVFESHQKQQKQAMKEVERIQAAETGNQARALNDLRREIDRSRDLDELITLARTETDRLGNVLASFQDRLEVLAKQNDEQLRAISYLEEQRRSDLKRTSEIQNEVTDLFKRINLQISKIDLLEDQIPQFGQFQLALEQNREVIQNDLERSQHQMTQIERQVRSWEELSQTVFRRLDEYENRMQRYAEQYQINQKSLESLKVFEERIVREQREFTEMQRLNFDRHQSRLEDYEKSHEEKLRQQNISMDQQINDIRKDVKTFLNTFIDFSPQIEILQQHFNLLLKILEEDALSRTIAAKEWHARFEQLAIESER